MSGPPHEIGDLSKANPDWHLPDRRIEGFVYLSTRDQPGSERIWGSRSLPQRLLTEPYSGRTDPGVIEWTMKGEPREPSLAIPSADQLRF